MKKKCREDDLKCLNVLTCEETWRRQDIYHVDNLTYGKEGMHTNK